MLVVRDLKRRRGSRVPLNIRAWPLALLLTIHLRAAGGFIARLDSEGLTADGERRWDSDQQPIHYTERAAPEAGR